MTGCNAFFFSEIKVSLLLFLGNDTCAKVPDFLLTRIVFQERFKQGMFSSNGHEGDTENGIGSGCKDGEFFVATVNLKITLETRGFSNPVALHGHNLGRPAIKFVQISKQLFSIISNFEEPAIHVSGFYKFITTPAGSFNDLLVGKYGMAGFAPVDSCCFLINQAFFIHLEKDLLFPFIIFGVAGGNFPVPVIGEAKLTQLSAHVIDVVVCPAGRMGVVFDGCVFCRESERVPAHGVQNIKTTETFIACNHIAYGIVAYMAHVNASGRIGKHFQDIVFFFVTVCTDPVCCIV